MKSMPTNEIYARHILATRRQQSAEILDEYLQVLKTLSKYCNYQNVSSIKYCEERVRDAFISGLTSGLIHQRLLENNTLDLKTMFDLARSLESAVRSSEMYMATPPSFNAAVLPADKAPPDCDPTVNPSNHSTASSLVQRGQKCFFCGY